VIARFCPALILIATFVVAGCGGRKQAKVVVPPPPPMVQPEPDKVPLPPATHPPTKAPEEDREVISLPPDAKPIYTETGIASWYGAPYHNRRGSNGEVYDMNAFTAAHRTLPLGSIVRVTNVKTGNAALVRITDRGPFIRGRILDLSLAAAKKLDVWQPGLATVKIELMQTPSPVDSGGRWAVQIGAFDDKQAADDLAGHLSRRYHTAQVLQFLSPTGAWWVRVRVKDDDRRRAEELAHATQTTKGAVFLVRLD
jgi:peptidoglycan lytic transglycosylase